MNSDGSVLVQILRLHGIAVQSIILQDISKSTLCRYLSRAINFLTQMGIFIYSVMHESGFPFFEKKKGKSGAPIIFCLNGASISIVENYHFQVFWGNFLSLF